MKKVGVLVSVLFASLSLVSSASATAHGSARAAAMLKVCPDASKCFTSVQAAIDAAASGDRIKIAAGAYQGSLVIDKDITLDGAGAGETIITPDAKKRVITVTSSSVTIRSLTVTGGFLTFIPGLEDPDPEVYPNFVGGGVFVASSSSLALFAVAVGANLAFIGGGIYNEGSLTLHNTTVSGNRAYQGTNGGEGGGIYSEGTLTLKNSTVSGNDVSLQGGEGGGIVSKGVAVLANSAVRENFSVVGSDGGIRNLGTMTLKNATVSGNGAEFGSGGISSGGTLIVEDSVISGNGARFGAGGIGAGGTLTVTGSTISGNGSGFFGGGGIENGGTMTLQNTTITDNRAADFGGGILNRGTATLDETTVSGNSASFGGGIYNLDALTLRETTVTGNTAFCTGGGLYNVVTVLLFASTISGNTPNDRIDAAPVPFPACV